MTSMQHTSDLAGPLSILTRQKRDHERLAELLRAVQSSPPGRAQAAILQRIARLVFPHAFAEEAVLWPVLRRVLPDGEELTLRVEQEHQEVNQLWVALEEIPVDDPRRRPLIDRLVAVLRDDVRDEEDVLLPRLQACVSARRLRLIGVAWEAVRRTAPTRPHPVVSRRPPGNVLAALPLSAIDRSRDALDTATRRSARPADASRLLGEAAARMERLAVFRRGEDRSTTDEQQRTGNRAAPEPRRNR